MFCNRYMSLSTCARLCKRVTPLLSSHESMKVFAVPPYVRNFSIYAAMGLKKHCGATFPHSDNAIQPVRVCGCAKRFFAASSLASNSGNTVSAAGRVIKTNATPLLHAFAVRSSRGRSFISGGLIRRAAGIAHASCYNSSRAVHVRGKTANTERGEGKSEGGKSEEEGNENRKEDTKKTKGRQQAKARTFGDHIRGLREDYMKFPDIYNSANAINFVIFTVFCLCSTGSNTEEKWWLDHWGLDNTFNPSTWLLHSFLCQNFLSMTFAMMLLHTMCHAMLPTIGSRGLLIYIGATATISGFIVWLGNRLYYGGQKLAPEKQFGPWDVVSALFMMEYLHYGVTPIAILNSFNSWIRYAVWVGEICILYFDWQTTIVGTAVGLALCKGVPRFRVAKAARP